MSRDTTGKTLGVATILAVVCSVLVASAAVGLRPQQEANKLREKRKNILEATGLYDPSKPVAEQFEQCEPRIVDLATGEYVPAAEVDPNTFDQRVAAKDPALSSAIPAEEDIARIRRRSNRALVYLVEKDGKLDQIVLPFKGKGLWSTMYGYVSLDSDANTVRGVTFYEHAETAGLGGEVSNPLWQAKWHGKKTTGDDGEVLFAVIRGAVNESAPGADYQVDGLSGATLTCNGVTKLMQYWLGEQGFGPFLQRIRKGG
ncbi:MAG: Na(+)-translocating NADH-quinone reductase subunit C [Planctomycetota bacterium]|jgi:Na+-transporting NADH:ubiquinone oxidoreductase subunit C